MYGNAFEAFIGAIYLDRGYECCKQFMQKKIIEPYIDLDKLSRKEVNFKSKLIEWSQKNKMEVSFELIEQFLDKENNPVFQTEVRIEGILGGSVQDTPKGITTECRTDGPSKNQRGS